jgi:hypothetical protein
VPLAALDDVVFGAWDVYPDDAYVSAVNAGVLDVQRHLEPIADALRAVRPMPPRSTRLRHAARRHAHEGADRRAARCSRRSGTTSAPSARSTAATGSS